MTEALSAANKLQVGDRLVWPVWILFLVQLGLWEGVVEIFDGHLIERNHVPEHLKLPKTNSQMRKNDSNASILNLIKSNNFIYEQSFTYKHSQTYFGFGTSFRHWAANVHFCASALLLLLSAGYSILIVSAAIIIYYKYMTWVHVLACTLD